MSPWQPTTRSWQPGRGQCQGKLWPGDSPWTLSLRLGQILAWFHVHPASMTVQIHTINYKVSLTWRCIIVLTCGWKPQLPETDNLVLRSDRQTILCSLCIFREAELIRQSNTANQHYLVSGNAVRKCIFADAPFLPLMEKVNLLAMPKPAP